MPRLAIVGSTQPHSPDDALTLIDMAIRWFDPEVVISGGAEGIDRLAASAAKNWGIRLIEYLPTKRQWAPDGYRDRNIKIAKDCTHLIRIANCDSQTYGSGWTADYAERIGKQVFRYYLHGVRNG